MIGPDELADIEGDAAAIYDLADEDTADPPAIGTLIRKLLGAPPKTASMRPESWLSMVNGEPRIFVRRGVAPARARWLAGHELAEWWYSRTGYQGADIEARCDTLGAALVAPRRAFIASVRDLGQRVHALADAFVTTQSLALLRIGEVTGRPVLLIRPTPIVRGDAFVWPKGRSPLVHPVRVDGGWGLMAA